MYSTKGWPSGQVSRTALSSTTSRVALSKPWVAEQSSVGSLQFSK